MNKEHHLFVINEEWIKFILNTPSNDINKLIKETFSARKENLDNQSDVYI